MCLLHLQISSPRLKTFYKLQDGLRYQGRISQFPLEPPSKTFHPVFRFSKEMQASGGRALIRGQEMELVLISNFYRHGPGIPNY